MGIAPAQTFSVRAPNGQGWSVSYNHEGSMLQGPVGSVGKSEKATFLELRSWVAARARAPFSDDELCAAAEVQTRWDLRDEDPLALLARVKRRDDSNCVLCQQLRPVQLVEHLCAPRHVAMEWQLDGDAVAACSLVGARAAQVPLPPPSKLAVERLGFLVSWFPMLEGKLEGRYSVCLGLQEDVLSLTALLTGLDGAEPLLAELAQHKSALVAQHTELLCRLAAEGAGA